MALLLLLPGTGATTPLIRLTHSYHGTADRHQSSTVAGCGVNGTASPTVTGLNTGLLSSFAKIVVGACGAASSSIHVVVTNGFVTPIFSLNRSGSFPTTCTWLLPRHDVYVRFSGAANNSTSFANSTDSVDCSLLDTTNNTRLSGNGSFSTILTRNATYGVGLSGGTYGGVLVQHWAPTLVAGHGYRFLVLSITNIWIDLVPTTAGSSIFVEGTFGVRMTALTIY